MSVYLLHNVSSVTSLQNSNQVHILVYNWCETKTKMWLLHLGQPVNLTVLNEAASIELGANLLGETVIFAIAAGILVLEYNRFVQLHPIFSTKAKCRSKIFSLVCNHNIGSGTKELL